MAYRLKMFDSKRNVVVVQAKGASTTISHSHEFVELVIVNYGKGTHIFNGRKMDVEAGDIFIIANPEIAHSVVPKDDLTDFMLTNIIFPFDFYNIEYSIFTPEHIFKMDEIEFSHNIIDEIIKEYNEKNELYENVTFSLTLFFLNSLLRILLKEHGKRARFDIHKQNASCIDRAMDFIHKNYDKELTVDMVAKDCGLCKAYLQRLFRKERDTSILEYIIKYKIEQACDLLVHTDYNISTISEMAGFNDLKYFYLKFKAITGETPSNYRNKLVGDKK